MGKAVICFHHQPFKIMIRFCSYINHLIKISLGENKLAAKVYNSILALNCGKCFPVFCIKIKFKENISH
jgi:hypothetical protein